MKCYDFELNISAYIEGHLQQVVRKEFNKHKETCNHCSEKLKDISQLMNEMPKMTSLTTSNEFIHNLNIKIQEINNQKPSFWEKLKLFWKSLKEFWEDIVLMPLLTLFLMKSY